MTMFEAQFVLNLVTFTAVGILVFHIYTLLQHSSSNPHQFRAAIYINLAIYVAVIGFTVSCGHVHEDLTQKAKAEVGAKLVQYDGIPRDCFYNDFWLHEKIGYWFRGYSYSPWNLLIITLSLLPYLPGRDQCTEYYQLLSAASESFHHVSLVDVASETFARLFHHLEHIGAKIGGFCAGLNSMFPAWLQLIVWILIFMGTFRYRLRTQYFTFEPTPSAEGFAQYLDGVPQQLQVQPPPCSASSGRRAIKYTQHLRASRRRRLTGGAYKKLTSLQSSSRSSQYRSHEEREE